MWEIPGCTILLAALGAATPPTWASAELAQALFQKWQRQANVPGAAMAIAIDGRIVAEAQAGMADVARRRPVAAQTEFRLGSVSKFVTTVLLAELATRRRLDLDLPVRRFVPAFPDMGEPITLYQLATHTSGIAHYQAPQDVLIDMGETAYDSAAASIGLFAERPLLHRPGAASHYSSFGFNLLGAALEGAAGQPYPQLLARLSRRIGAPSLQVERLQAPGAHWSRLYAPGGSELPRLNISHKWPSGGLLANAGDLAMVGMAVLDRTLISASMFASFVEPARLSDGRQARHGRDLQAVGWRREDAPGTHLHHSGTIAGGRAHLSLFAEERTAVAILANANVPAELADTARALALAWREQGLSAHAYTVTPRGISAAPIPAPAGQQSRSGEGD